MSPVAKIRPAVPLLVLIVAGCIIAAIGNGVRTSFGLFTLPMTSELGLTREQWGMAMAIQNLAWGIAQPFAGAFAIGLAPAAPWPSAPPSTPWACSAWPFRPMPGS